MRRQSPASLCGEVYVKSVWQPVHWILACAEASTIFWSIQKLCDWSPRTIVSSGSPWHTMHPDLPNVGNVKSSW